MDSILGWGAEIPMPEPKTKTKPEAILSKKKFKKDFKKWSTCKRKKPLLLTQIKGWTPRVGNMSFARLDGEVEGKGCEAGLGSSTISFPKRWFCCKRWWIRVCSGLAVVGGNQDEKPHLIYDLCTVRSDRQTWASVWVTEQGISNALSLLIVC